MLFWILATALLANAHDNLEPTDRLVPTWWKGNPWGPLADAARQSGTLPKLPTTKEMDRWQEWGRTNLHDGDIVFRRGSARILFGYFPMSRFVANVSGSPFSHTGIVAMEKGDPFVYDSTKAGVRRQPLSIWVLDNAGPFGVKRPKPARESCIPAVLAFCRGVYAQQVPFDYKLGTDDTELYCVEMTEKAYRASGLKLSDPIRLGDMDRAPEFPICMFAFVTFSDLTLEQEAFFPGNDKTGIWSCPDLETICPPTVPATVTSGPPKLPEHKPKPDNSTAGK